MNLKKTKVILFGLVLASVLLGACAGGGGEASSAVFTEAALIAADSLTQTASAASPTPTATPVIPTATPTEQLPTATVTEEGQGGASQPTATQQSNNTSAPCLRANLEYETINDGTEIAVGKGFTKTWRLKNTGSCTWSAAFTLVWVQGDLMGADSVIQLTAVDVPPNSYANVDVAMIAPSPPGSYKSYWMLRSADGIVFGIGINGKEWFWVDIKTFDPNID